MTREIKLALVLGFGLLLFSGILVSDHLAAQQRGAAENLAQANVDRTMGPVVSPDTIRPTMNTTVVDGTPQSPQGGARPAAEVAVLIDPPAIPVPGGPAMTQIPAAPLDERLYSVQSGETLASICRREYGSTKLLTALADYNKSAVPNPARMRTGVTIRLPSEAVLRGDAIPSGAQVASTVPMSDNGAQFPSTASPGSGALRTYTVKPGDIPGRIAQSQLGSARHVDALMKANPGVDARRLKPGTVLTIPNIS